jgi:hypothetical protein
MCIFQPGLCPQCTFHSAHFDYHGTGAYETNCGRCAHSESYRPEHDADDGVFCGYTHIVRKGAGVLWFRIQASDPSFAITCTAQQRYWQPNIGFARGSVPELSKSERASSQGGMSRRGKSNALSASCWTFLQARS